MKTATYKSLGLNVNFSIPESVEEFDLNAKAVGACLREATNNVVYRGMLTDFRDALCDKLSEVYGIEREEVPTGKKTKGGEDITKYRFTEEEFVEHVLAVKGLTKESIQPIADEVAAKIVFDASAAERKAPKPKKLPAQYATAATAILAKHDDAKINKTLSKYLPTEQANFVRGEDAAANVTTLGWLLKAHSEAKLAAGDL